MKLRTKIFRHLVLIAAVPSIILAISAYFLLDATLEQTNAWLESNSPDRTINALRLVEARLQAAAVEALASSDSEKRRKALDWSIVDSTIYMNEEARGVLSNSNDSLLIAACQQAGPIRKLIGGAVIVGYASDSSGIIQAGGFVLDGEYVSGFHAATESLREGRNRRNLLPAFVTFLGFLGFAILVIVIVLAFWLSRRLSRGVTVPLEELAVGVAQIGQGGRLPDINNAGTDEVDNLASAFGEMADELESNRRKLLAAERVQAWQEFARRMAHELKNPLTPISLSLYRIKKKLQDSNEYDRFADSIEAIAAEVAHLERLASDYSSLAKLPEPKMVEFDFKHMSDEVVALHEVQLEAFDFSYVFSGSEARMIGDRDRIREVLINIVKNALDFCTPGGKIDVAVRVNNDSISVIAKNDVRDVADVDVKKARIPYFTTRKGGSGLGLAVSDKIIMDHGGNLSLYVEGSQAVVRIDIPRGNN
ncbi:MAG: ATP-binding protein [Candidatus Zixiibacteriota bacterium]